MDILNELEWRGAINQVTDEEGLRKLTSEDKIALYCGTDPTGDSLHIGHLIPFMILKRFQLASITFFIPSKTLSTFKNMLWFKRFTIF